MKTILDNRSLKLRTRPAEMVMVLMPALDRMREKALVYCLSGQAEGTPIRIST